MRVLALLMAFCMFAPAVPAVGRQSVSREYDLPYDHDDPFVGFWSGGVSIPARFGSASLDITRDARGQFDVQLTLAPFNIFALRATNTGVTDGVLRFELPPPPPATQCVAELRMSENSQRLEGTIRYFPPAMDRPDARIVLVRRPRMTELTDVRSWTGVLDQEGSPLPMTIRIGQTADGLTVGRFDIPEHNYYNAELSNLVFDEDLGILIASIPEGVAGMLDLEIKDGGRRLEGTYQRGSTISNTTFEFDAFHLLPMWFSNSGGGHTFGELTVPAGPGPHPCVIILGTFGPNDRDGIAAPTGAHKPYKRLAEALTREGLAVFRFDDRGLGLSRDAAPAFSINEAAADAALAIQLVSSVALIDPERLVLLGHGEGGMIAPMLAKRAPHPAGVVLINAPSGGGIDFLVEQARAQMTARNTPPPRVNQRAAFFRKLLTMIAAGDSEEAIRQTVRENVAANRRMAPPGLLEQLPPIEESVDEELRTLAGPWTRSVAVWDMGITLASLEVPVLAIFAGLDTQVPAATAAERASVALGSRHSGSVVETFAGLNHYMQPATTGLPEEYATLTEPPFADAVVTRIVEWIKSVVGTP